MHDKQAERQMAFCLKQLMLSCLEKSRHVAYVYTAGCLQAGRQTGRQTDRRIEFTNLVIAGRLKHAVQLITQDLRNHRSSSGLASHTKVCDFQSRLLERASEPTVINRVSAYLIDQVDQVPRDVCPLAAD